MEPKSLYRGDQQDGTRNLRSNISAEEINSLPLRTFSGKTVVVSDPEMIPKVVREIRRESIVGFDTETRPSFRKGQIYKVSLLQLAVPHKAFLIRLNHTGITTDLISVFEEERIVKAGVGIRDDIKALQKIQPFQAEGFLDLSVIARQAGLQVESVKKLTALLLGFRISKSAQTSNWEAATLTKKQIEYAATDAWVCLELYRRLTGIVQTVN